MGVPIPVGTSPQKISSSVTKPYLIYNAGQQTVYLGLDTAVSPGNFAFPLAPGNAMQWSELSTDVYGVCATGASTVVVAPEASALALGAVTAQVTNPVTIGGGSVGISGTAQVAGSVTASQRDPVLLDQVTTTFGTGAVTNQMLYNTVNWLYMAGYQSVMIVISGGYGSGTTPPVSFTNYIQASYLQRDSSNGITTSVYKPEWLLDVAMGNTIILPVTGLLFIGSILLNKAATSLGGSITVSVYGLGASVSEPQYSSASPNLVGTIPVGGVWSYTNNNTASNVFYLATKNNQAQFSIYGGGSAGFGLLEAIESGTAKGLVALYTNASTSGAFAALKLPLRPIRATTQMSTPTAVVSLLQG